MKKLSIFIAAIMMVGCTSSNDKPIEYSNNPSELSLDWGGVYKGVFPCADCQGIDTTLTLNYNGTYALDTTYKKGKFIAMPQAVIGKIEWDKEKPIIYLNSKSEQRIFFIGEGYVKAYDAQGKPIKSKLNYTLKQVSRFDKNSNLKSK